MGRAVMGIAPAEATAVGERSPLRSVSDPGAATGVAELTAATGRGGEATADNENAAVTSATTVGDRGERASGAAETEGERLVGTATALGATMGEGGAAAAAGAAGAGAARPRTAIVTPAGYTGSAADGEAIAAAAVEDEDEDAGGRSRGAAPAAEGLGEGRLGGVGAAEPAEL